MSDPLPPLNGSRLASYNLARLRRERHLTAEQAAEILEPFIGVRWSRPAFSLAERTYSHETRGRQFTVNDVVALSLAFDVPPGYFLIPPPDRMHETIAADRTGEDWLSLVMDGDHELAAELAAAGHPETLAAFELPERANLLTARQRHAVISVIDAMLAVMDDESPHLLAGNVAAGFTEGIRVDSGATTTTERKPKRSRKKATK